MRTESQPNHAAAPIAGLIGGTLGASAGVAAHIVLDDRGLTLEEWLRAFPFDYGADLWAGAGAILGLALVAAVRLLGGAAARRREADGPL